MSIADAGVLTEQGITFIGIVATDAPVVVGHDDVSPLIIYPAGTTAPTWASVDQRTPGLIIDRPLSADPTARIMMGAGRAIRENVTLGGASASISSDPYVYDPVDVPASVFDAPQTDAAACSR